MALLSLVLTNTLAQNPPESEIDLESFIERLFPIQDQDIDYESIYEVLFQLYLNPININFATTETLQASYLLTPDQINNLINYRDNFGPFISLYELQAIPEFNQETIEKLIPFLTIDLNTNQRTTSFWNRLAEEEQGYLIFRHRRIWETRKGFTPADTSGTGRVSSRYLGDANELYLRFRVQHSRDFSLGFTLDKDAGEQFIWDGKSARYGFNFFSFHFTRYQVGKWKTVAIGDYQVSFGQGLIFGAGYSLGKGAETVPTVRRSSIGILPYTAALEFGFFRGVAATYQFNPKWQASLLGSYKPRDARIDEIIDSLGLSQENFSSINQTGLHRTPSELATKNTLNELSLGSNVQYTDNNGEFSFGHNALFTRFDREWERSSTPYNQYEFSGKENFLNSLYFNYNWKNFYFFGETAVSSSKGTGTVLGFVSSLSNDLSISLLWRRYDREFHSFFGNAFAESTRPINERGIYLGIDLRPIKKWRLTGYFDFFRFPWLRYRVYSPSSGQEWLTRLSYRPNKKINAFFQLREERKNRNLTDSGLPALTYQLSLVDKLNSLLSLEYQVTEGLFIRSRVLFSRFKQNQEQTTGFMALQDVRFGKERWRLTGRIVFFDTDDYDNRQYTFENNVLWAFSLPAFSGQGMRYYLLGQYDFNRKVSVYLRFARTIYTDREVIGSGLQSISGNSQTETNFLLKYNFNK